MIAQRYNIACGFIKKLLKEAPCGAVLSKWILAAKTAWHDITYRSLKDLPIEPFLNCLSLAASLPGKDSLLERRNCLLNNYPPPTHTPTQKQEMYQMPTLGMQCHAILCLCQIGVRHCVFEIRQLLVGDISLSPEFGGPVIEMSRRETAASKLDSRHGHNREFLFPGFDCETLDNLNKEPRSVLQGGSVSSEALGGKTAWQPNRGCA